jgi:hypothetical protein
VCLDFGLVSFSGIKIPVTVIAVTEIFIPENEDQDIPKGGSRFCVLDYRKSEKEKSFGPSDMAKRTEEEIGVPSSFSRTPGF